MKLPTTRNAILSLLAAATVTLASQSLCLSQTPRTNSPAQPKQVWDYAEELGFTPEQRRAFEELRTQHEESRTKLRETANTNTPPDVQRAAQLGYSDRLRMTNRRIAELLTAEQRKQLEKLRLGTRGRASTATAPGAGTDQENDAQDTPLPVSGFTRNPPRPEMSDEEISRVTKFLRDAYSKPAREWPPPEIDDSVKGHFVELGLLPPIPYPTNNPYTFAKAELGKRLFFDPRLSGSGQISCASCHDPDLGFADGRTVSFGNERKELKRNAPTILNIGLGHSFFWDGRAETLEQQATDVVHNQDEMNSNAGLVEQRLNAIPGYTNEFQAVFGNSRITMPRVAQAIATFERTITSRGNSFDSFLRGDTNALSDAAVRGLHLFRTTARCINCHHGPNFTDERFHNEGLSYYGRKLQDLGRYEITKKTSDVGAFKTPSLRNIARTAPYMHNGLFDLDGVLNMYNAGMPTLRPNAKQKDDPLFPVKSPHLEPLGLNAQDLSDLKAFLESLTETRLRMRPAQY